jgi:hypothetical protein
LAIAHFSIIVAAPTTTLTAAAPRRLLSRSAGIVAN